jgi:hypothetical protein
MRPVRCKFPFARHPSTASTFPSDANSRCRKAYGELPDTAKINETDTFGPNEDGDCGFEFDEDRDSEDEAGGAGGKDIEIDDI